MKALIINADDIGLSKDINRAVKICLGGGVVTAASITACGPAFADAVEMMLSGGRKEAGVHLTLTGGMVPCVKDRKRIDTLLCPNGRLGAGYMDIAKGLFTRRLDLSQVREEFLEQINRIKGEGLAVTHLDAHEHVHMFPGILDVAVDLAVKCEIPYIRVPIESFRSVRAGFGLKDIFRYSSLRFFASGGTKALRRLRIAHNHRFLGHFHSGRIDNSVMEHFLSNMEEGLTELAVHPGIMTKELLTASPWHKNAEKEFKVLTEGAWREKMNGLGIELVSHTEAIKKFFPR